MARDLSIVIPARNEMFLRNTVEDILKHREADTEIIVALDGQWADPGLDIHERVTVVFFPESIGQRAATNQAVKMSRAKYIMKVDAHCSFDQGFDRKMIETIQGHDDWTMVPLMKNLHVFDWVCGNGHRRYQGPSGPCEECGGKTSRDIVWIAKDSPKSTSYRFDKTLHFQYWKDFEKRPEGIGDVTPTMSLQGSCWMLTRKKYWELEICDEEHGSWGQQGVEVACKTWLSGGQVMVNKKTWYAHLFRTQGGDFGFPYPNPGIQKAREYSRNLWLNNQWPKAKYDIQWLLEKFAPVPGWDISKGIVYYTDNEAPEKIMKLCQEQLRSATDQMKIMCVSLKPLQFGTSYIHLGLKRGYLTMFKQILKGLESIDTDVVFFTEHDVLYHPSHFEFTPPDKNIIYYNTNVWKTDGKRFVRTDDCRQTSGLCAYRETLLEHYRKRVKIVTEEGFNRRMGFEPGTHNRAERVDNLRSGTWESKFPNIDIRHEKNLTKSRWSPEEFKNKRYTKGWVEKSEIPGWEPLIF